MCSSLFFLRIGLEFVLLLMLEYFSKKGDIVFDPFMGTGTTAIASIKQGRNYLGTEITKEYIDNDLAILLNGILAVLGFSANIATTKLVK